MDHSLITTDWVKQLASRDMMAIEAVISKICEKASEGQNNFALFDGGAHKGYHTIRMARLNGCSVVYAIEADPIMAQELAKNLSSAFGSNLPQIMGRRNPAPVKIVEAALQDDPDCREIIWKSSTSHSGRSSIQSDKGEGGTIWHHAKDIVYRDDTHVHATTIDKILSSETRPLPFLKLDLEGADILSLFGAECTLRDKRPIVAFENSVHAPKVHNFSLSQFREYLEKLDYVPIDFSGRVMGAQNWFGFFEAWLAPVEKAEWLKAQLPVALSRHGATVQNIKNVQTEPVMNKAFSRRVPMTFDLQRAKKNTSSELASGLNPNFPEETQTEGWLALSRDVADELWCNPRRRKQPVEDPFPYRKEAHAPDHFLDRVRKVMRMLATEGLHFQQKLSEPRSRKMDQNWMLNSGRMAWLLWLYARRSRNAANEILEKAMWQDEASDYRHYVRTSLRRLRRAGILFSEE